MNLISNWFHRTFSDRQVVILAVLLIMGTIAVLILGEMLAPVLASLVIAYLLEGLVGILRKWRIPRLVAVLLVFISFVAFMFFLLFGLLPLLWQQMVELFGELPMKISWFQKVLLDLPERFPGYVTEQHVIDLMNITRSELTGLGQRILTLSVASARAVIWALVYIFLMPLLVFFFLKDKERLLAWGGGFLPTDRRLSSEVWHEVNRQIGNYARGKIWEIMIVWTVSYITFTILGLKYAMLISLFVGLSVLIPYIGATFMAFPVAFMAYFQWGPGSQFLYVVIAYIIIQILDGNVLVTLLFSEVVNIHPIAIIVSILVFGGIFGFWGVFFAIPLATLIHAIIKAWTRQRAEGDGGTAGRGDEGTAE